MATSELQPLQPHRNGANQATPPSSNAKCYDTFAATTTQDEKTPAPSRASSRESWLSKLFLDSATPVMELGNERQLNQEDLLELEDANSSAVIAERFKRSYRTHNHSLERTLVAVFGWNFFVFGIGSLAIAACGLFGPVVVEHVVDHFGAAHIDAKLLALWCSAFFATRAVSALLKALVRFRLLVVLMRVTVSLKTLLFEKALKRSVQSKRDPDVVDISNLFTVDMGKIVWAGRSLNLAWIVPIKITFVVYMLYRLLDLAAFTGVPTTSKALISSRT
ncbi:hypothetical protein Gpo141_00013769 [Globisporangium polare]